MTIDSGMRVHGLSEPSAKRHARRDFKCTRRAFIIPRNQTSPFLFLLPSLGRLPARTRAKTRNAGTHEPAHHPAEPTRGHHAHHLSHLGVLVNHLIHFLNGGPAAARDSFPSGAIEQRMIEEALLKSGGNKAKAAEALGLSRQGLLKKIKRLAITN